MEGLNSDTYETSTDYLENGLNNEAYESSTDNLENVLNDDVYETSTDYLENGLNNEAYESSTDNLENVLNNDVYESSTDNFEKGLNNEAYDCSTDTLENGDYLQFEVPKPKLKDETFEISKDNSINPHFHQFEIPTPKMNTDEAKENKEDFNPHFHQFEIPKPKIDLNTDQAKENKEDITINKKVSWNGLNGSTEPQNDNNKKVRIKAKRNTKVRKSIREKLKILYTNMSFVLLMISLAMFLVGKSIVFTHILPYAVSENISSSVRLLLVSILGCSALVGKLALGAFAQLPRVNPIVLYITAICLSGMTSFLLKL